MRYLPHTPEDISEMLQAVGASSIDDLFSGIPQTCRRTRDMDLPEPYTEWELNRHMDGLAKSNADPSDHKLFLGAGMYDHYIPAAVSYLLGRSEVSTAYTPYQPEISQGTLQAIFEYQTLTSRLLGMDVANASMYDGASALAEALLMAIRVARGKKTTVAVSELVHPNYRRVVETYFRPTGYKVVSLPWKDGRTDLSGVGDIPDLAAVAVQSPNFFGCIEDLAAVGKAAHDAGALFVTGFTEPLAYGLYKNPGSQGADIACGEGQSFGIPKSYGGPGLGMFTARDKFVRNMPGRLIGQTVDRNGERGFVLTLATREQHIRREKATSNICSNQGLCATTAAMYMATLGGVGIRNLARLNYDQAEYLKGKLKAAGVEVPFSPPTFNEFVAKFPAGFEAKHAALLKKQIVAGLHLKPFYPDIENHYLLCVTETLSKADIDALVKEVTS